MKVKVDAMILPKQSVTDQGLVEHLNGKEEGMDKRMALKPTLPTQKKKRHGDYML